MHKLSLTLLVLLTTIACSFGQPGGRTAARSDGQSKVFTQDIDNFWVAFDSAQSTKDSLQQLHFIQTLYIDKGTEGLKAFMKVRNYSADRWVMLINKYPKFWASVRSNTLAVKTRTAVIEQSIVKFKTLYPELKEARLYFTVGGLRSGGTTDSNMVLVGTEIATGTATTDVSEFSNSWLAGVFKEQSPENIVPLNIHEYVHTQQKGEGLNVLGQCINEGAADFITELVLGEQRRANYIKYGYQHESELKESFKQEMFTASYGQWLYNGSDALKMADLGYFMGYVICKSYYTRASDKKKAAKEIVELNYSDSNAVESFLARSGYYKEPINKTELMAAFRKKQPYLLRIEPFSNGDTLVDASLKKITVVFSKPMRRKDYSFNYGAAGKEHFPITSAGSYSDDGTSFTVNTELKPGKEYEFIITNRSFISGDGYPLAENYTIRFKTKS